VQHLAPDRHSLLPEILGAHCPLPVVEAHAGDVVQPDHVYVMPANTQMHFADGALRLEARPHGSPPMPVDFLFRSLAHHARDSAIAVVLSGTGSDGAQGIREVKATGGITIAQDPATVRYDGMPRAAIATEAVDLVLRPDAIAREIAHLGAYARDRAKAPHASASVPMEIEDLDRVFTILRDETGVDFTAYKRPTIRRRLERRMVVNKTSSLPEYVDLLSRQPGEVRHLYRDLLIHVTRFFREPGSFDALARHVFPALTDGRSKDSALRIWTPGCSSGEEAYSLAIALLEYLGDRAVQTPVQIFATDLSEAAIERARSGLYPENIAADVSPERLQRFFTRSDGGYRVRQVVRDLCVFARQDVTRDPPFSKIDLIVCRNLMIYLSTALQQRLLRTFHYALRPKGFLMLGEVETTGANAGFFELIDKKHKLYARSAVESGAQELSFRTPILPPLERAPEASAETTSAALLHRANALLLDRYAPAALVVDANFQIVHARGRTGPYLELSSGAASLSLLRMAREGLAYPLRMALQKARKTQRSVRRENVRVRNDGASRSVHLEVSPLSQGDGRSFLLVIFEDAGAGREPERGAAAKRDRRQPGRTADDSRVRVLEQELEATREHLQSMIHDLEAANEELQSANEEILSSNEELQSTNEELDTAREELQSTNEEINTVNEELQGRNEELVRANSDLMNLLGSVQVAIVIVSNDLRIRRFTPMAERTLNLISSDVGRPIGHIKPNIDCPDLEALIAQSIDAVTPFEREVQDSAGGWYLLRVRPYKNVENRIDGAILALLDVSAVKKYATQLGEMRSYASLLFELTRDPLLVLDRELRVVKANEAFLRGFDHSEDAIAQRSIFAIAEGRLDETELRAALESPDSTGEAVVTLRDARAGVPLRVAVRRLAAEAPDAPALLLRFEAAPESRSH
jgi:two-component system CheB/CheR fusion protein